MFSSNLEYAADATAAAQGGASPTRRTHLHEWLYLALVCALPLEYPFSFKIGGLTVQVADLIFVAAAFAWFAMLIRGKVKIRRSKFYLPLALYALAMIASTVASVDPRRSAFKLLGEFYLLGLAALTFNLITSTTFLRRTLTAWVVGTAVTIAVGALGVVLFYLGLKNQEVNFALHIYGSLPPGYYPRIDATFVHTNMLCNYLNLSLALVFIMGALRWLNGFWFRVLVFGICIVALFTFSTGLGGVALTCGLWMWLRLRGGAYRRLGQLALGASSVAAVAFLFAAAVTLFTYGQSGFAVPGLGRQLEPSHRAEAWRTAFETFEAQPLLGRGVGMEVSNAVYTNPSGGHERLTDAHNMWLSIAGEKGLIGLFAFVILLFFLGKRFVRKPSSASSHNTVITGLAVGFVGALLYQSLSGSFENARHMWVFFGMIAAVHEMIYKPETDKTL